MKKKYFYILAAALIAVVTSCSLYLEEDDIRTLHTEDGYTSEKTISSTDGTTVTYQYNQRTIPIDDEVEQYIVQIESDTILYFVDGTPDHLLPEEGEMMVCSFRDRFPHAFCHRCIERTQVNGLYRCVFTPCSLKEAFDKFDVTAVVSEDDYTLADGVTPVDDEEMDSILAASEYDTPEEAEAAASRWRKPTLTRALDPNWAPDLSKKSLKLGVKTTLEAAIGNIARYSASVEGTVTLGLKNVIRYSREHEELEIASGFFGKFDLTFDVTATGEVLVASPVAIPIAGFKADFIVAGAELGITANPYIDTRQTISASMHVCFGFNHVSSYINRSNVSSAEIKGDNEKKAGIPAFYCTFNTSKDRKLNVQMGIEFRLGIGLNAITEGGSAALGLKIYSEINQDMDDEKFHSAKEFRDKNADFPTFVQLYSEGAIELFGFKFSLTNYYDPYPCKILKIPYFPKMDPKKCSFYCSNYSPRRFKMAGVLEDVGLLGAIYRMWPIVRVFERLPDEAIAMGMEEELVEVFEMRRKNGLYELSGEGRSDNIKFNTDYYAQFAFDTRNEEASDFWFGDDAEFYWPLYDLKFNIVMPEIAINHVNDVYHDYGPFQKVVKGTENDFLPQYTTYNYCYTIDVMAHFSDSREMRRWGIHMNDIYSNSAEFEKKNDGKKDITDVTVRFYWYSNRKQLNLSFFGYCYAGKTAGRINFTDPFLSENIQIVYDPTRNQEGPPDYTPDYDVNMDNDRKSRMKRPYSDDDVIMSFVDAGTGDYCEVVSVSEE